MVCYASRTLTKAERKYCATRKEMLALVWSLGQFRPYLYGKHFTARSDHGALLGQHPVHPTYDRLPNIQNGYILA